LSIEDCIVELLAAVYACCVFKLFMQIAKYQDITPEMTPAARAPRPQ